MNGTIVAIAASCPAAKSSAQIVLGYIPWFLTTLIILVAIVCVFGDGLTFTRSSVEHSNGRVSDDDE